MFTINDIPFLIAASIFAGIYIACSIACFVMDYRRAQSERFDAEDAEYQEFDKRVRERYKAGIDRVICTKIPRIF